MMWLTVAGKAIPLPPSVALLYLIVNSTCFYVKRTSSAEEAAVVYLNMGQGASTPVPPAPAPVEQPPKKKKLGIKTGKPICCCCPDTKKVRDECVVFRGEDDPDCQKLIEAHKMCLREEGFDVK